MMREVIWKGGPASFSVEGFTSFASLGPNIVVGICHAAGRQSEKMEPQADLTVRMRLWPTEARELAMILLKMADDVEKGAAA